MNLRLTTAGRALLADGTNTGTAAVALTHLALGSGSAAAGAANDAKTALITERDRSALGGAAEVAGQIAFRADFSPSASYSITEAGLFGRVGASGAVTLIAYWTAGGDALAAAVSGAALTVGGVLEVQAAAADVTVTIATTVQFGDPALAARVTAVEGVATTATTKNTAQDTLLAGLRTDLAAMQAAAITTANIGEHLMTAELKVGVSAADDEDDNHQDATYWSAGGPVSGVSVSSSGGITFGPGVYRVTGYESSVSSRPRNGFNGFLIYDSGSVGGSRYRIRIDDLISVATGASATKRGHDSDLGSYHAVLFIRRVGDAPA